MKDSFVDVKATLDNNTKVIIEMQVLNHKGFEKRVLYNMAKNYSIQLNKAEDYHLLNPVIALNIVDFIMFEDTPKTIANFKLLEKEEFIDYSDDIELIFIELPKFKKELQELNNLQEKFIYFIKNADTLNLIPKELEDISQALSTINEASLTKEELELQHKRKEFISVQKSSIDLAKEQGLEQGLKQGLKQGIEQGIEQGKLKEKLEIAKNLLDVLDNETIASKTGLEIKTIQDLRDNLKNLIKHQNANEISGFMITANPLNRAQERMIRQVLDKSDILILFLLKPFKYTGLRFDIRYEAIMSFIENFLPTNRVVVVPLENTYIFSGYNELVLDALVAKNYGCTRLIVGKNHAGLGLYYDENRLNSIFDASEAIKLEVSTVDQYVYCDLCRTLVSNSICPHGQHHHIHYHSPSIMKLIRAGIMPPSVLVRREVSASILSTLFPDRFKNLQELYDSLVPNEGIMEKHSEEDFYIKLMGLYQTTSLT